MRHTKFLLFGGDYMYDIDMNNLGQRLREYRKAKNITIEELGKQL